MVTILSHAWNLLESFLYDIYQYTFIYLLKEFDTTFICRNKFDK